MKKTLGVLTIILALSLGILSQARGEPPPLEEVIRRVQGVYARQCCFSATFDQLTVNVAMDLKDQFHGTMYVRKPNQIALEVDQPEPQKVVVHGRSYTVYFPQDGSAARGEVPADLNLEHFFGFFANMGNLERDFSIQFPAKSVSEDEKLIFLELTDSKNPKSTYRILLGIDRKTFNVRRAIIYDALGNYNRFDLSDLKFLTALPDSLFSAAPGPADNIIAPFVPSPQQQ